MSLTIALNKPQTLAHRMIQPNTTTCLPWGRGVGKSWFERFNWYEKVAQWDGKFRPGSPYPGVRIVLLMPTFKHTVDVHASLLQAELNGQWKFLGGEINRTKWLITFPGGSWIQFFGAKEADSARGLRCDVVTLDECDDIDPSVNDAVVSPWFSEPHSLRIKIASGTPLRGRFGLLYKLHDLGRRRVTGHHTFHATYRDVPETVSPEYVESIRQTTPPSLFRREWECNFDSAEGLVYGDVFNEAEHVREAPPGTTFSEHIVGVDHGFEDPGVFLRIGVTGSGDDATCYVLDEIYQTKQEESWWVAQAQKWVAEQPRAKWYPDPSRPDRIKALRKQAGCTVPMKDGDKADVENAIEDGVSSVADRLVLRPGMGGQRTARLYISPRCTNLIREFGLYRRRRDPKDKDRILEAIAPGYDHGMDALRYAIHNRFRKPIAKRGMGTQAIGMF